MDTDEFGRDLQDNFDPSAEQKLFQIAKRTSVGLAIVALMFSALDLFEIRSYADAAKSWQSQVKPQIVALLESADSERQRLAFLSPVDSASDAVSVVAAIPKPIPVAISKPVAIAIAEPAPVANPAPAAVAIASLAPAAIFEPAPVAISRPARAPVLASLSEPAAIAISAPAASVVSASAPQTIPESVLASFPLLASVPLPRPAPGRSENADEPRPPTPAEQLGLDIDLTARAKAEKCLANAVYYESRSEPLRGQIAVAQVVMNRVFSPFYPKDVCSVVYQNAHRRLACQFTFACDGKRKVINERGAWARANRIAKQTLDGKLWVPEVAKSTHYHAVYVHPNWVREMRKMFKTGIHQFYRPYNWGDGSNEPGWGTATKTAAKTTKLN